MWSVCYHIYSMALLMMKYELSVVLLIPMVMVILLCIIIALLTQYLHFSFIMKSVNIFNVIFYVIQNISLLLQMTCSTPSGPKLPCFPPYYMSLWTLLLMDTFLRAFDKLWKVTISFIVSVSTSIYLCGTIRFPLDRLSWNSIYGPFLKTIQEKLKS
jgi:hypothetical protein